MTIVKLKQYFVSLIAGLTLFLTGTASGQEVAPEIALSVNGGRAIEQSDRDPMLFIVHIFNGSAANISSINKENLESLDEIRGSDRWNDFPDKEKNRISYKYRTRESPSLVLGSQHSAVSETVQFVARDAEDNEITLKVRPLASTGSRREAVSIDGTQTFLGYWGVDAEESAKLPEGRYTIQAVFDTMNQSGMWQGKASSNNVVIDLYKSFPPLSAKQKEARLYQSGLYYRLDEEYDSLDQTADQMIRENPSSIGGWTHKGDALYGNNKPKEALDALNTALDLSYAKFKKNPPPIPKEPTYIIRRIVEIQRR